MDCGLGLEVLVANNAISIKGDAERLVNLRTCHEDIDTKQDMKTGQGGGI